MLSFFFLLFLCYLSWFSLVFPLSVSSFCRFFLLSFSLLYLVFVLVSSRYLSLLLLSFPSLCRLSILFFLLSFPLSVFFSSHYLSLALVIFPISVCSFCSISLLAFSLSWFSPHSFLPSALIFSCYLPPLRVFFFCPIFLPLLYLSPLYTLTSSSLLFECAFPLALVTLLPSFIALHFILCIRYSYLQFSFSFAFRMFCCVCVCFHLSVYLFLCLRLFYFLCLLLYRSLSQFSLSSIISPLCPRLESGWCVRGIYWSSDLHLMPVSRRRKVARDVKVFPGDREAFARDQTRLPKVTRFGEESDEGKGYHTASATRTPLFVST